MLELLVHAYPEPALLVRAGRIAAWNAAARALLESLGAAPGAEIARVLRARSMAPIGAPFAELVGGRAGAAVVRARFLRPDSPEADLELEVAVTPLAEAGAPSCFVVLRDLAARSSREVEEFRGYRGIVDRAHDLVLAHDLEGRILYANAACQRILGYAKDEIVGMNVDQIVAESAREAMAARERRRREGDGGTYLYEVELVARDGRVTPFELNSSGIEQAGRLAGVFVIARDVTERRRTQEALRRSEDRFRAAAEGSYDAFFLLDGVRDERGRLADLRIVEVNRRGLALTGAPRRALVGRRIRELLPGPGADLFVERCSGVIETGKPLEEEFTPISGVVSARRLRHQVVPVGDGVAITARDVTEQRRLEDELRHSQKMEAIGRLAGGVAHDFNNLLTVINGYADLLLARSAAADPEQAELQEIRRAGERAAALTQQLLAFSRRQVLKPERLDLNTVVTDMEGLLRRLIGEHIVVETRLAADLGRVHADRGQIQQVLMNLVVNARDAMESGGTLVVETANTGPAGRREPGAPAGPHAMLLVRDTGCGMDEEVLGHVFEPFFTTKPAGKGTGLGLSTVYGIVQQSGGLVTVNSRPDEGTAFRIFLPIADAAPQDVAPAPSAPAASGGNETVLLVEDEELVGRLAGRVLVDAGYTVLRASDGVEAEALFAAHAGAVDVLVTDVVMPRVGGPELASKLRARRPGLPVLFLSGYNDDAVLGRGVLEPATAFVAKPFTPDALTTEVRRLLDDAAR